MLFAGTVVVDDIRVPALRTVVVVEAAVSAGDGLGCWHDRTESFSRAASMSRSSAWARRRSAKCV